MNLFFLRFNNFQSGMVALFTIIVVSAAALIMALSASFLGLGELEFAYTSQKGGEAFFVTDGCAEEALRRIRLDTSYGVGVGAINLSIDNGSCIINIIDLGGNQRSIVVTGTVGDYNKKTQTNISLSGNVITIDSWEESPI